jgi:hypothetical protein
LVKFKKKKFPKIYPNQRLLLNRQSSLDCLRIGKVLKTLSYLDIVFASMYQAQNFQTPNLEFYSE